MTKKEPEPAWLQAAVDQRLAFMREKMGPLGLALIKVQHAALLMTPLTEPADETQLAMDHWENSCDNCKKFVPKGLWTGSVQRDLEGIQVVITFGACSKCAGKEE